MGLETDDHIEVCFISVLVCSPANVAPDIHKSEAWCLEK